MPLTKTPRLWGPPGGLQQALRLGPPLAAAPALALALALAACGDDDLYADYDTVGGYDPGYETDGSTTGPTEEGQAQRGTFEYVCIDVSDPSCFARESDQGFPDRVQLGGVFGARFTSGETSARGVLEAATPGRLEKFDNVFFRAPPEKGTGAVSVLARDPGDGSVLDFVSVEVVEPADIRVAALRLVPAATGAERTLLNPGDRVTVGDYVEILARMVDADEQAIAGTPACTWSVEPASALQVLDTGTPFTTGRLVATVEFAGPFTARVTCLDKSTAISVEADPADTAGTGDTGDTGNDETGADSTTDGAGTIETSDTSETSETGGATE